MSQLLERLIQRAVAGVTNRAVSAALWAMLGLIFTLFSLFFVFQAIYIALSNRFDPFYVALGMAAGIFIFALISAIAAMVQARRLRRSFHVAKKDLEALTGALPGSANAGIGLVGLALLAGLAVGRKR